MNNMINKVVSIVFWVACGWLIAALNPKPVYKAYKKIDKLKHAGSKVIRDTRDSFKQHMHIPRPIRIPTNEEKLQQAKENDTPKEEVKTAEVVK